MGRDIATYTDAKSHRHFLISSRGGRVHCTSTTLRDVSLATHLLPCNTTTSLLTANFKFGNSHFLSVSREGESGWWCGALPYIVAVVVQPLVCV